MDLPYKISKAIQDQEILNYIDEIKINLRSVLSDDTVVEEFCKNYKFWVFSSLNNTDLIALQISL